MGDRIRRIEEVFEHCVDFSIAEQDAYLASLQEDSDVIGEVRTLLRYADQIDETMFTHQTDSLEGTTIDRYHILSSIGEGGFGVVYLAQQQKPISRQVALKVIKPGMDSRAVIARFEAERQTLALMDHPGVARIFDGGMTSEKRPYFVMEFVQGESITSFCDRHRLSIADRIGLFRQACDAVQHAHTKGIIHRDLKPSNILVAYEAGTATVKIIDFGIAKALNQSLSSQTLFTSTGQLVGTPEYMSPEQAEMTTLNVDTRTDVYSLGVILYELLAGNLPFSADELRSAGIAGIQQIIRDKQPAKPSTKCHSQVNDAPESASAVAYARTIDATSLPRRLKGDLDWIVMKCLEKERSRRYESPAAIESDLERHLGNRPVEAGPPSVRYRANKFIRRNRRTVIGSSIVGFIVIGSAIALIVLGIIAYNRNFIAVTSAEFMKTVLNDMVEQARESGDNTSLLVVLDIAEQRGGAYEEYPRAWVVHMNLLVETYQKVDDVEHSRLLLERTLAFAIESLGREDELVFWCRSMMAESLVIQDRHDAAARSYASTLAEATAALGVDHEQAIATSYMYLGLLHKMGRHEEALSLARTWYSKYVKVWGESTPENVLAGARFIGLTHFHLGDHDQALEWFDRAMLLLPEASGPDVDYQISVALLWKAKTLYELGRLSEAERVQLRVVELKRAEHGIAHGETARALNMLAKILLEQGKAGGALGHAKEAYAMALEVLGAEHPDCRVYRSNLMKALKELARWKELEPLMLQELEYCQTHHGPEADETSSTLFNLSRLYEHLEQPENARRYRGMISDERLQILDQDP